MRVALLRAVRCTRRCSSSAPLAALRAAELAHRSTRFDLEIADADAGGHAEHHADLAELHEVVELLPQLLLQERDQDLCAENAEAPIPGGV